MAKEAVSLVADAMSKRVIVLNKYGKPVVLLAAHEKGNSVAVYDKHRKTTVGLLANEEEDRVAIVDKHGKVGVLLAAHETHNSVAVYDKKGNKAVGLGTLEEMGTGVVIWDKAGNVKWSKSIP